MNATQDTRTYQKIMLFSFLLHSYMRR
jgi:hypothetical protein